VMLTILRRRSASSSRRSRIPLRLRSLTIRLTVAGATSSLAASPFTCHRPVEEQVGQQGQMAGGQRERLEFIGDPDRFTRRGMSSRSARIASSTSRPDPSGCRPSVDIHSLSTTALHRKQFCY
jgi:hypothetical protein